MASWDPTAGSDPAVLSFDQFELHLDSGELLRAGTPVKLQPQPEKVLEVLARRAGEVVSREEIQALVWGEDTFLDADASLNFCIKQIRRALDDPASSPRYVETIPRRGYRFLVPAEIRPKNQPAGPVAITEPTEPAEPAAPTQRPRQPRRFFGIAAATLALIVLALFAAMQRPDLPEARTVARSSAPQLPPEAHEHYLKALYVRRDDPVKAVEELTKALLLAPDSAEVHAMLAWLEIQNGQPPASLLPDVELTARRAVELDPDLSMAHLALGGVLLDSKLDWKNGEAEIRRSIQFDPGNAEAWHALAKPLAARGKHQEAIAAAQKARELDPEGMVVNADLAWFYYLAGHYDEAIRQARSTLELKPKELSFERGFYFRWALRVILHSAHETGDRRAALEASRELRKALDPAAEGRLESLEEFFRWERSWMLTKTGGREQPPPPPFVLNAMMAGRPEHALAHLEEACRQKWPQSLLTAAADPLFVSLHGDPRFERFLDCIGVPADAPSRRR